MKFTEFDKISRLATKPTAPFPACAMNCDLPKTVQNDYSPELCCLAMKLYLQGILFTRASNYAAKRGFRDDKEREAIVDGWLAGHASAKRKDPRVERLLAEEERPNFKSNPQDLG